MTPAHRDSLRRSEVFRGGETSTHNVTINDDDEERRQARRRTLQQSTSANDTSTFEDNETLKKCLEIYNGSKLSRENAWSLSLIDTLSSLLDRHHKSLNNFKVAGSSLEASSKVYGLRVDSIHMDVLRMSAGLNAQKFSERNLDDEDDDGVATGGDGAADPGSPAAGAEAAANKSSAPKAKQKRARKLVSTITKNKDTLNARLDTVPLQDPVFGKLNSIVGSINASNRLMINIVLTGDSVLKLRTNFQFFDAAELTDGDFTEETANEIPEEELSACDRLYKVRRIEELELRPLHSGYVISDTPEVIADDKEGSRRCSLSDDHFDNANAMADNAAPAFHDPNELSMAFDINAECEPLPPMNEQPPMLEVDYADYDDLTTEERTAINNCRGLRKAAVLIEDLRPVDASSKLEYSYRPLDKISQFWAGPSHWKFKRTRSRPSTLSQAGENIGGRASNVRGRRALQLAKKQSKQLNFTEFHDELFIKLDNKYKARKVNMQKKWDQRKLKLPTDLQLDAQMFSKFQLAPGLSVQVEEEVQSSLGIGDDDCMGSAGDDLALDAAPIDHPFNNNDGVDMMNLSNTNVVAPEGNADDMGDDHFADADGGLGDGDNMANNTVLEIATEFDGAPSQVTKIIVPFAKRAKVIDMKNLKRCCTQLLHKQMKQPVIESQLSMPLIPKDEKYAAGIASFKEIYQHLPELLNPSMAEAVTPSIAFYSVLHLANDFSLRLIQQDDLEDFKIRQLVDETTITMPT